MQRRFVTCFRDIVTHIIAVPRTLHSTFFVLFCGTEFIVDHKTQTNVRFELNTRVDDVIVFYHNTPEVLVESRAYIHSELLTQWNAGCKTLNNDHYDNTYYQRLSAFHVLLLYD